MSSDEKPAAEPGTPDEPVPAEDLAAPAGARAMAIVRWLLVVLMAAVAAASIGHYYGWFKANGEERSTQYYCPMHPAVVQDHPGECPICSMTLVLRPAAGTEPHPRAQAPAEATGEYYCPMHPDVTSNDPNATCDKCNGMKLVPRPAPATTPAAQPAASTVPGLVPIQLTADRIQLTGMRTGTVKRGKLAPELRTVATLAASEKGLGTIQVRFAGWIEKLFVEQTGQRVDKGQVLATIFGPEVLAVQQEYLNALRWAAPGAASGANTPGNFKEDARHRLELLGISESEIAEIEHRGQPMRAVPVRATVSGYVTQKNAIEGLYVQPGTALFEVANLATVWALADIYEHDVARVHEGQKAQLELAAFPGEKRSGKVTFISPTLDPTTRTLRVRMEFPNKDQRLKPGMYGTVTLELEGADGLIIPREALVDTGTMQYVFVAKQGGQFEPRRVTPGSRAHDMVQILSGVAEGEVVVTTANFLFDAESRLRATIEGVSEEPVAPEKPSVRVQAAAPAPAPKRPAVPKGGVCETQFDQNKHPDRYQQCRACAVHRGMGAMEQDCISAIAKPWK